MNSFENPNPQIFEPKAIMTQEEQEKRKMQELDENIVDEIDTFEVYDLIRSLKDPEYPLTLEELNIIQIENIIINNKKIKIYIRPTISWCTQANLIGLIVKAKLQRCLPQYYHTKIKILEDYHDSAESLNKQLNDKERVEAALENSNIVRIINRCSRDI